MFEPTQVEQENRYYFWQNNVRESPRFRETRLACRDWIRGVLYFSYLVLDKLTGREFIESRPQLRVRSVVWGKAI